MMHKPKPPEGQGQQKTMQTSRARKIQSSDEVRNDARRLSYAASPGPYSQPPESTEPEGIRLDEQGMILPHSILGTLEDFRSYLELKGDTELVKRISKSHRDTPSLLPRRRHSEVAEHERGLFLGPKNIQSNALEHWHTHMRKRRRQQDFLSGTLHRPVEVLLMNQGNGFREIEEKREFLNQVMPLIHSGYGYRVGSEFWSLPQFYGDELSGITATLTQREQGKRKPFTYIGQPSSIRAESGIMCGTTRSASRTWDQSVYLEQKYQELQDVLKEMDIKKPDIGGLEVIGLGKSQATVMVARSPLLENEEEGKERKEIMNDNENVEPKPQCDDAVSTALLIPALRFCGQLASWTGNSPSSQGEVGISATIIFEALAGEMVVFYMELVNEGCTAIFFSWQQLPLPHTFSHLRPQARSAHFYFNSSSGVILPGDVRRVEFTFKSERAGIKTELWQLNTYPMLLQGAALQVTLKGLALYQDTNANQRQYLEAKLEHAMEVQMCRSIVYEMLRGICTPERSCPSGSPAELYINEEQQFLSKNPNLQYIEQPVRDLKELWEDVNPGVTWDLSIETLRQAVFYLPVQESTPDVDPREKAMALLNDVFFQFTEPSPRPYHLTAITIGQQLWRSLLDTMANEAIHLRHLLSLPERDSWIYKSDDASITDSDMTDATGKDKSDKRKAGSAKDERSKSKCETRDAPKSGRSDKSADTGKKDNKKTTKKKKEEPKKRGKDKQGADLNPEGSDQQSPTEHVDLEKIDIYTRLLHQKVYALMEDLVNTLCGLMDELKPEEEPTTYKDLCFCTQIAHRNK